MREEKFHIYLNDDEYSRVIQSLIRLKNSLIEPMPFITTEQTIIYTVYSKTVLPIRRLKICKIKSITEKPQEPTSHELPKGSAMTLPEFMVFLFQSKDKQTNKRGDENGLQSIDRSRA